MEVGTPLGETVLLELNSQLLTICQSGPNKVSISFDELSENLRHQVSNYELQKVNYKTVVSSIKGQHPHILKASLQKNCDQLFVMTITVTYQFLPEIKEEIQFDKRQIQGDELEEVAMRNMKNYLQNTKQQIKAMTNVQILSGKIQSLNNQHEIYFPIPHPQSLITWTIKLEKPSNNLLKAQLYYYNSATRNKQSSKMTPDEGVYLYFTGGQCTVELRFVVEQSDKYDTILLQIQGKQSGQYLVSIQKAQLA